MTTLAKVLSGLLVAALAAAPAAALAGTPGIGTSSPVSVFPQPRDPWKSWGVRTEVPRHVGPPRTHERVMVTPSTPGVWVQGQWVWDDSAGWVWWPGYWVR